MFVSRYQWRFVVSVCLLLFFIYHTVSFLLAFPKFVNQYSSHEIIQPGIEFADLKEKIPSGMTVGFLTNKDMSAERNDGQFLAAQYILAPVVLDLNNDRHAYLIFDDLDPLMVSQIAEKLSATIVLTNSYNKVLAVKNP